MCHHRLRLDPLRSVQFGPPSSALLVVASLVIGFVLARPLVVAAADPILTDPGTGKPRDSVALGRLVLVQRVLAQDQGDWQVDYAFKNAGTEPIALLPKDVGLRVEGWLSNSRIAAHANPKHAACVVEGQLASTAFAEVITAAEELKRCRERVTLSLHTGSASVVPDGPKANPSTNTALASFGTNTPTSRTSPPALVAMTVEPGELVRVRIRFEHQHILHGDYDPLLGRRDLELRLGATTFHDALPLDREQYRAQPRGTWPEPPTEVKDSRHFVTAPDSLHLDADLPGANYYPFPQRKVRYSTRMRLRFWYRIAPGTEGELHARIAQYCERPDSWKPLTDGSSDIHLSTANGSWVRFETIIRTEAEATTLQLDFRITPCDVGEVWIDDVVLEPADGPPGGP